MEVIEVGRSAGIHYCFPKHQHGCWEILLNLQGSGVMEVDEKKLAFGPGDIYLLPPGVSHGKESVEGFRDMSMFIDQFRSIGSRTAKCFCDDARGSVRQIMEMAYDYSRSKNPYEMAAVNVMGDLIYQLLVSFYKRDVARDIRLDEISRMMHENISNAQFDVSAAIEQTGYSKGYFRKIFKACFGEPPVAYFNRLRIDHAKNMIQQFGVSRSIKDVALACGFEDPLYFSRVFRQLVGVSPREYMAKIMQGRDMELVLGDTPKELLDSL